VKNEYAEINVCTGLSRKNTELQLTGPGRVAEKGGAEERKKVTNRSHLEVKHDFML